MNEAGVEGWRRTSRLSGRDGRAAPACVPTLPRLGDGPKRPAIAYFALESRESALQPDYNMALLSRDFDVRRF